MRPPCICSASGKIPGAIVAITGQVPTPVVGNDAFQEADITGITMPVTKHNFLVKDPAEIVETVREAFHIASTGRPGPVLIDLPKDVLNADVAFGMTAAKSCTLSHISAGGRSLHHFTISRVASADNLVQDFVLEDFTVPAAPGSYLHGINVEALSSGPAGIIQYDFHV